MFGRGIPLFDMFGFKVRLDLSWFFLAFLIIWTLSVGFFPFLYPGLPYVTYLGMGVLVTLGLFFSIVVHEFAHAWVARKHGMPMGGITLFLFGGVAEMEEEAPDPKVEFLVAIAGPLTSVLVLLAFFGLHTWGLAANWPIPVMGVLFYMTFINLFLILFNMIPAFPLDGGRVLRSVLWAWKNNVEWATRITSRLGGWFGMFLIILGIFRVFQGLLVGGIWFVLIGWFLRNAARMSYQQVLYRQELQGEPVRRFLEGVPTVFPDMKLSDLVNNYFYKHYLKTFPVEENGRLIGWINFERVQEIPHGEWPNHTVRQLLTPRSEENTISVQTDALNALSRMQKSGKSLLMVVEGDHLVGLLSLENLLKFLSLKTELEKPA